MNTQKGGNVATECKALLVWTCYMTDAGVECLRQAAALGGTMVNASVRAYGHEMADTAHMQMARM